MGTYVSISGLEAADRLEIRELVDACAHCADRRDAKGQMSLFTNDTHLVVFMDAKSEICRKDSFAFEIIHLHLFIIVQKNEIACEASVLLYY
jgi:SnoaL-like domain